MNNYLILLLAVILFSACDDYLDVEPKDRVIPTTGDDFRDLLTSAYKAVPADKAKLAIRTDQIKLNEKKYDLSSVKDIYLWNDANPSLSSLTYAYQAYYKVIMYANHIISEGDNATESTQEKTDQIVGEAYVLRAYMYFNLVNLYGKPYNTTNAVTDKAVPLALEIDSEAEFIPGTLAEVYTQILLDVEKGLTKINLDVYESGLNYRFSKLATLAFQSRVYLYMGEYTKAKEKAMEAMKLKSDLQNLNENSEQVFYKYNSDESILALETTIDGNLRNSCFISEEMKNAFDQQNDLRFSIYFKTSEDVSGEFLIAKDSDDISNNSIRTSELYLILAECNARLNEPDDAKDYLNQLKAKRLTADFYTTEESRINAMNQSELIDEIADERFRELAFEGHRWFDLRRTTQQSLTHSFKGETVVLEKGDPRYTLPYPKEAINNNPNLEGR